MGNLQHAWRQEVSAAETARLPRELQAHIASVAQGRHIRAAQVPAEQRQRMNTIAMGKIKPTKLDGT